MAMDHNLYSQDLEENIELRNDQIALFRWLFGKKYHKSYQKKTLWLKTTKICFYHFNS